MNNAYSTMTACQDALQTTLAASSDIFASAAPVDFQCKCNYNLGMSACLDSMCPGAATVYDQVISVNCAAATNGGVVPTSLLGSTAGQDPFITGSTGEILGGAATLGGKKMAAGAVVAGVFVGGLAVLL